MPTGNGKPRTMFKVNRKRRASGDKLKNAQKNILKLQTRIKKEGETAWLKDAMKRAQARLKKYGLKA